MSTAHPSFVPFCLLLLLVISAGCARPPDFPVSERPAARSFEIAKLKERSDFWRDYQCKFRLRVDSKTSKFSSRAIVFVKGRDFVRFETFTPFGQTAALYVSNETGPALLIPSEKVIFTAQRPETLVREFLGVTPAGRSLSLRAYRFGPCPSSSTISKAGSDAGAWRLISNSEGSYFEWQITAGSPALKGHSFAAPSSRAGFPMIRLLRLSKEAVPDKIRISSSEWNMEIIIEELKPASQFQPSAFYMPNLPDVRKVDLDKIK